MNLGIAFQLVDDALDYGGTSAKLGKNVGDDFREGKITLPVVLSYRRGSDRGARVLETGPWSRARSRTGDLDEAVAIMRRHRALDDTIERARHYGAMARDALALFPEKPDEAGAARHRRFLHRARSLRAHGRRKSRTDLAPPGKSERPTCFSEMKVVVGHLQVFGERRSDRLAPVPS